MKQFYVILFTLISFTSPAQELLKDITSSNGSSQPREMVTANGKQFFIAKGIHYFEEIWVTDGTSSGTQMVVNRNSPNAPYLFHIKLNSFGDKVLFAADKNNPSIGTELWISDGTSPGTQVLKDIYPGYNSSSPDNFNKLSDKMVFLADDGFNGKEPWITDGTAGGTFMLKDINPGIANSSFIAKPIVVNNKLFFATSVDGKTELWVTDGTTDGTYRAKDIALASNYTTFMASAGTQLFFIATDETNGTELWVSDGTEVGTRIVKDISSGAASTNLGAFIDYNGKLMFLAGFQNTNFEIWLSDGTSSGTQMIHNEAYNYSLEPQELIKVANTVFFSASDKINGRELWKTDGTSVGTVLVKDINSISTGSQNLTFPNYFSERKFFDVNGQLFFLANSGTEGFEIWKSDGTSSGTTLVKDFVSGSVSSIYSNFIVLGSTLCFAVNDNSGQADYWKSDGTEAGTIRFRNLPSDAPFRDVYPLMISTANQLYFAAFNDNTGYELYKTNGNTVNFLKDIEIGQPYTYYNFTNPSSVGNDVVFLLNDNEHGVELWKTDGFDNTKLLKDFSPYPSLGPEIEGYYSGNFDYYPIVTLNGYGYFNDRNTIWRTDGESISLVQKFNAYVSIPCVSGNKIRWFSENKLYESDGINVSLIMTLPDWRGDTQNGDITTDINGITLFHYVTNTYGKELWRTDGTPAGTYLLKDFTPGTNSTAISPSFRRVGNQLFFTNYTDGELWVTDGTDTGTQMVKDINPGFNGSYPNYFTNLNDNLLIFTAYDDTNGRELWKSDGTYDGTVMISDINTGSGSSSPSNLRTDVLSVLDNKVYYKATGASGDGLYVTDGNSVSLVKGDFDAQSMITFNNELFIGGKSNSLNVGYELWKSDGTTEGTVLLKDIYPGTNNSSPGKFFVHKDKLFFTANDGLHGEEIWIIKPCPDSLNITSTMVDKSTYQAGKVIVGETANKITQTAKITYDATKYILLKPGFSTYLGAVFQSKIGGCISQSSLSNEPSSTSLIKTNTRKN